MDVRRFLDEIRNSQYYQDQIAYIQELPGREPVFGEVVPALNPEVEQLLHKKGIQKLYSHQAEAINAIRGGEHTVIVTGTASGKSLCYNLPVIESCYADRRSKALFIPPKPWPRTS
jgi:DEAD/DEAH box helicase domain-containing protein